MNTHRLSSVVVLAAALFALAGCESQSMHIGQYATPAPEFKAKQAAAAAPATSAAVPGTVQTVDGATIAYQLQPGDQIDVKFYYNPELNEQLLIGPDLNIALQLVGEVNVAGMSPAQLSDELSKRYAKSLRQPQATVILRKYAQSRIFVAGEVLIPGAHTADQGPLTALQAILQSGGFKKGAERRNVVVLRNSGSGHPQYIKLDLQAHLEQTSDDDLMLRPYDIVFVPQRPIAEVADFMEEYVNKIIPIYRNMGFSFTYDVRNRNFPTTVVQ